MGALVRTPVIVRWREPADDAAIARIAAAAFGEYTRNDGRTAARMIAALPTLVAARGGEVLGFVSVDRESANVATIPAIAVVEGARGTGVGRRLLTGAEKAALARGARRMTLHTAEANVAAFELFVRNGYSIGRRIPRYYRGVFDACVMSKTLRA